MANAWLIEVQNFANVCQPVNYWSKTKKMQQKISWSPFD